MEPLCVFVCVCSWMYAELRVHVCVFVFAGAARIKYWLDSDTFTLAFAAFINNSSLFKQNYEHRHLEVQYAGVQTLKSVCDSDKINYRKKRPSVCLSVCQECVYYKHI